MWCAKASCRRPAASSPSSKRFQPRATPCPSPPTASATVLVGAQSVPGRVVLRADIGEPVGPGQPIVIVVLDDQQGMAVQQVLGVAYRAMTLDVGRAARR